MHATRPTYLHKHNLISMCIFVLLLLTGISIAQIVFIIGINHDMQMFEYTQVFNLSVLNTTNNGMDFEKNQTILGELVSYYEYTLFMYYVFMVWYIPMFMFICSCYCKCKTYNYMITLWVAVFLALLSFYFLVCTFMPLSRKFDARLKPNWIDMQHTEYITAGHDEHRLYVQCPQMFNNTHTRILFGAWYVDHNQINEVKVKGCSEYYENSTLSYFQLCCTGVNLVWDGSKPNDVEKRLYTFDMYLFIVSSVVVCMYPVVYFLCYGTNDADRSEFTHIYHRDYNPSLLSSTSLINDENAYKREDSIMC